MEGDRVRQSGIEGVIIGILEVSQIVILEKFVDGGPKFWDSKGLIYPAGP